MDMEWTWHPPYFLRELGRVAGLLENVELLWDPAWDVPSPAPSG